MKWIQALLEPATEWIQIEISSHCNSNCVYCPHTQYESEWQSRFMTYDTFQRILPALMKTRLAYLQGWGEPLLHPDFFEFVAIAKKIGCLVGSTTNGNAIEEEMIDRFIDSGLDILTFSLAGIGNVNDEIRKGTSFESILKTIKILNRRKRERQSETPMIHLAFLLLRSNLDSLWHLSTYFADVGIDQVVITTLDFVPNRELKYESLVGISEEEQIQLRSKLHRLTEEGRTIGIPIHYYGMDWTTPQPICTENVQQAVFISSDGFVSPCVFMNLPVSSVSYVEDGKEVPYQRRLYGNINETSLRKIWYSNNLRTFRKRFNRHEHDEMCRCCPKLYQYLVE